MLYDPSNSDNIMYSIISNAGGLVGPLIYGVFIDLSCLLWQSVCDERGSCLVYDIELYRNLFMGVSLVIGGVGAIFIFPSYFFIRKAVRERPEKAITIEDAEM